MLKRLKVWTYLAVLLGGSLLASGCDLGGIGARTLVAILNEEIFG